MRKTDILTFIGIILIAVTLSCIPALAASTEYVTSTLYFNVQASQEITVTLVNDAAGFLSAVDGNDTTSETLNFTCSNPSCWYVNATLSGGAGGTQAQTTPALKIQNTGTAACQLNITSNNTGTTFGTGSCISLYYVNDTDGDAGLDSYPPTLTLSSAANVTIVGSFVYNAIARVWLFGNFTGCAQQVYVGQIKIFGYWT